VQLEAQPVSGPALPIVTRIVDDQADLSRLIMLEGRLIRVPGEAIVPQGLLDHLKLDVGDTLQLQSKGRPLTLRIVGRYYSNTNLGLTAIYGLETARQQIDPAIEPTEYALTLVPGTDGRALRAALLRDSDDRFGALIWEMGEETGRLQSTVRGIGIALLLISLINLLNTALLSVQENLRDLAVFKALGMTPGQVVTKVLVSITAQALPALALGVPIGILLSAGVYAWVTGRGGGGGDVPVPVDWLSIAAAISVTVLLVAAISSILPARRAAALPVVEVLRHE
jgi:putative ABC transport system permease protein